MFPHFYRLLEGTRQLLPRSLIVLLFWSCGGNVQATSDPRAAGGVSGVTSSIATGGSALTSNGGNSSGGNVALGGTGGSATAVPYACQLPVQPGNCDAYMPSYYFDVTLRQCKPFVYGGCGGNANRFPSLQACIDACDPGGLDRCVLDTDCRVAQIGCCGACEPVAVTDFSARNVVYASFENCPGVACGACPPFEGTPNYPNLAARCAAGICEVYDVRE